MKTRRLPANGFTIIELLIAVALVVIVLALALPSFQNLILVQRLKSVNQQLVTDLQLARGEAVSRNTFLRVGFGSTSSVTCYVLFTSTGNSARCDCTLGPGAACSGNPAATTEVKTVQVDRSLSVQVNATSGLSAFAFDPVTGGIYSIPTDLTSAALSSFVITTSIDSTRYLKTTVAATGRPSVCAGIAGLGYTAC